MAYIPGVSSPNEIMLNLSVPAFIPRCRQTIEGTYVKWREPYNTRCLTLEEMTEALSACFNLTHGACLSIWHHMKKLAVKKGIKMLPQKEGKKHYPLKAYPLELWEEFFNTVHQAPDSLPQSLRKYLLPQNN